MSTVTLERRVDGVLTNATLVRLQSAPGDSPSYGIKDTASGAVVVAAGTVVAATAVGIYEYDTSSLPAGTYQVSWEITSGTDIDYEIDPFTIDVLPASITGVRLMDIEQNVARRVGEYFRRVVSAGSSTTTIVVQALRSNVPTGRYQDMYIYRRGLKVDGSRVIGFNEDDAVRVVTVYDNETGSLVPDRVYAIAPIENEVIELHTHEPIDIIRTAVLAGLKRCFIPDNVVLSSLTTAVEHNMTALIPWLTSEKAITGVYTKWGGSGLNQAQPLPWWKPFTRAGNIWLQTLRNRMGSQVIIEVLRPADTLINGVTSLTGPTDHEDTVAVDLAYATAAAHVEVWRIAMPYLSQMAAQGATLPLQNAAREFTKISTARIKQKPSPSQLTGPYGWADGVESNAS